MLQEANTIRDKDMARQDFIIGGYFISKMRLFTKGSGFFLEYPQRFRQAFQILNYESKSLVFKNIIVGELY